MDYSEVEVEDFEDMLIYTDTTSAGKVSCPVLMGIKLLTFLAGNVEDIEAQHDQLWSHSWDNVRKHITDYDIKLLVSNGWFINEEAWSHYT